MEHNKEDTFMTWGQANQAMRVVAVICAIVIVGMLIPGILSLFKSESSFIGTWRDEESGYNYFTFYSDGTCQIRGEYGTCQWDIVDGKLKIITFYGETKTYSYEWEGDDLVINGRAYQKSSD